MDRQSGIRLGPMHSERTLKLPPWRRRAVGELSTLSKKMEIEMLACLRNLMIVTAINQFRALDKSRGISLKIKSHASIHLSNATNPSFIVFGAAVSSTDKRPAKFVPRLGSRSTGHQIQPSSFACAQLQPCVQPLSARRSRAQCFPAHHAL